MNELAYRMCSQVPSEVYVMRRKPAQEYYALLATYVRVTNAKVKAEQTED